MAKLFDSNRKLVPVKGVEGAFILDPSFRTLEQLKKFESDTNEEIDSIVYLCDLLLRDENGEKFEDVNRESLMDGPGFIHVTRITQQIEKTLYSVLDRDNDEEPEGN